MMPLPAYKSELEQKIVGQPDDLGSFAGSAEGVQTILQAPSDELLTYINGIRTALAGGTEGAALITAVAPAGLEGANAQALIDALSLALNAHKTSADHDGRYQTDAEIAAAYYNKTEIDAMTKSVSHEVRLFPGALVSAVNVGLFTGFQIQKAGKVNFSTALDPEVTSANVTLRLWFACNNTDASKKVKYGLNYLPTDGSAAINGSGVYTPSADINVPTTAYLPFTLDFSIPANDYIGCELTRISVSGDPDPTNDPVLIHAALLYNVRR